MDNLVDSFANRLTKALNIRNMKPIELAEKTNIDKSKISSYMAGRYKAKTDGLKILADTLNVSPVWLMGYDVPMEKTQQHSKINKSNSNIKNKHLILTHNDRNKIIELLNSLEKRLQDIDKHHKMIIELLNKENE